MESIKIRIKFILKLKNNIKTWKTQAYTTYLDQREGLVGFKVTTIQSKSRLEYLTKAFQEDIAPTTFHL